MPPKATFRISSYKSNTLPQLLRDRRAEGDPRGRDGRRRGDVADLPLGRHPSLGAGRGRHPHLAVTLAAVYKVERPGLSLVSSTVCIGFVIYEAEGREYRTLLLCNLGLPAGIIG